MAVSAQNETEGGLGWDPHSRITKTGPGKAGRLSIEETGDDIPQKSRFVASAWT